jgi:hypothetical protein
MYRDTDSRSLGHRPDFLYPRNGPSCRLCEPVNDSHEIGQLHVPAVLPPEKEPLVSIGEEAGWIPEPVWTRWWREKFPAPAGTRTPDHPICSSALYHWDIPTRKLSVINDFHEDTRPAKPAGCVILVMYLYLTKAVIITWLVEQTENDDSETSRFI